MEAKRKKRGTAEELHVKQLLRDTVFKAEMLDRLNFAGTVRLWRTVQQRGLRDVAVCSSVASALEFWGLEGEHKGPSADDCVERC